MKLGYVHAMAAVLLGGGAVLAQAPMPVDSDPPARPRDSAPAPRNSGLAPAQYATPAPAAPVVPVPEFHPDAAPYHEGCAAKGCLDNACSGFNGALVYGSAEYLLWKIRQNGVPNVVNTIPVGVLTVTTMDTNVDVNGNTTATGLNQVIHFFPVSITANNHVAGTDSIDPGNFSGGRVTAGFWTDSEHCFGLEGSGFLLERRGFNFANAVNTANNQFIINTPFTNNVFQVTPAMGNTPASRALFESFPVFFVRQANLSLTGDTQTQMWGAEANARSTWCYYGPLAVGGLAGVRYVNFEDELTVDNNFTLVRPAGLPSQGGPNGDPPTGGGPSLGNPLTFMTFDNIQAHNHFIGGQLGLDLDAWVGRFNLSARGLIGMGAMVQVVDVFSFTSNNDPRAGGITPGGLLSGAGDEGRHTRTRISFLPEIRAKIGYALTRNVQIFAGYNGLYLTNVARSGSVTAFSTTTTQAQIVNTNVNLKVSSPTFAFSDTNVWAQGFDVGVEVAF